jgi:Tfp pilus assembly protein FimT
MVEMVVVAAIIVLATAVAVVSLGTALSGSHVNSAVQITVNELRKAHEEAVDRRVLYTVTFAAPGTIVTQRTLTGQPPVTERTISLPSDVQFAALAGIPGAGATPDGFGIGTLAIDFDQANGGGGTVIFFKPDGTATDALGNPNDGVVYLARPGQLYSSYAVTMFGATGRFKVWQLTKKGGAPKWQ